MEQLKNIDLDEPPIWLRPFAPFYAMGRRLHRGIYQLGLQRRRKLSRPVICIGNLTVGGTGKTPFLIYFVHALMKRGLKVAILSRGYHADPPAEPPRLVSDGNRILIKQSEAGDEPYLIALKCPGAIVAIGPNRFAAGELVENLHLPDLFLLDDGFQHERLERDADIVLWDMRDVPDRMRQLPAGRLRESVKAIGRGRVLVLTHKEYIDPKNFEPRRDKIVKQLKRRATHVPVFEAQTAFPGYRSVRAAGVAGEARELEPYRPMSDLKGKRAVLVSGLARAGGFVQMVLDEGIEVISHLPFPDHARYDDSTLKQIEEAAASNKADFALTTEKDAVKFEALGRTIPNFHATGLVMSVTEAERWDNFVDMMLEDIMRGKSVPLKNGRNMHE